MPTEGCRRTGELSVRWSVTAIKQECLKMFFKTMFRIAQHDFCRQTVPNDPCDPNRHKCPNTNENPGKQLREAQRTVGQEHTLPLSSTNSGLEDALR